LFVGMVCCASQPLSAQQIRGRVVESESREPLSAATVSLLDGDMAVRGTAQTDSAGNFLFDDLAPGLYLVQAEAGGRFSSISPPIDPASYGDSVLVVVPSIIYELAGSCGFVSGTETVLAGIVRADGTGVPLPGSRVTVHWEEGAPESTATTDAAGRYRFCGVPANRLVQLQVSAFGRTRSVALMLPDATLSRADLSLDLEIGASSLRIVGTRPLETDSDRGQVSGRVLDIDGERPLADVLIRVEGANTTALSAVDGSFILNVKEGDVVLEVEHLSFGIHRELVPVRRGLALDVEVLLAARPVALDALQVEGRSAATAAARMSATRFDGFSGADLAAAESRGDLVMELVRTLPGVTVMEGMFTTRHGLQSGVCLTTSRRMGTLSPSPGGSSTAPWCESIPVYVDDVLVADGVAFLRSLRIADYESIQLLHPTDAHIRYGLAAGAAGGALVLWTRGRGPHVSRERHPSGQN
jgi:hypothetical protein